MKDIILLLFYYYVLVISRIGGNSQKFRRAILIHLSSLCNLNTTHLQDGMKPPKEIAFSYTLKTMIKCFTVI